MSNHESASSHETIEGKVNTLPLETAVKEMKEYMGFFGSVLDSLGLTELANLSQEQVRSTLAQTMIARLEHIGGGEAVQASAQLIEESVLLEDLAEVIAFVAGYMQHPEDLENDAVLLDFPDMDEQVMYVAPEVDRFLLKIRNLGLIPFETIETLRETRFSVVGASVAAETIELLAALGAENITFYDDGDLERSNQSRMPGGAPSSILALGKSKAKTLEGDLKQAHPHADGIKGVHGRVLLSEADRKNPDDVLLTDIMGNTDVVIEVADSGRTKTGLRQIMKTDYPDVPVVYIGDLGHVPVAGIETGDNPPFNQQYSDAELAFLNSIANSAGVLPQQVRELEAIKLLVRDSLPTDHQLEVLAVEAQLVPFFSQTAIASRLSAAIAVSTILEYLQTGDGVGINYDPSSMPQSFMSELTDAGSIGDIYDAILQRCIAIDQS